MERAANERLPLEQERKRLVCCLLCHLCWHTERAADLQLADSIVAGDETHSVCLRSAADGWCRCYRQHQSGRLLGATRTVNTCCPLLGPLRTDADCGFTSAGLNLTASDWSGPVDGTAVAQWPWTSNEGFALVPRIWWKVFFSGAELQSAVNLIGNSDWQVSGSFDSAADFGDLAAR